MPVQGAPTGPRTTYPGQAVSPGLGWKSPDPDGPALAPANSLAPAATQQGHPGSLGVVIMCDVALGESDPSGDIREVRDV